MKTSLALFVLFLTFTSIYAENNNQNNENTKANNEKSNDLMFFVLIAGSVYLLRHTSDFVDENLYGESSGSDEEDSGDEGDESEGEEEDEEDDGEEEEESENSDEEEESEHEDDEEDDKTEKETTLKPPSLRRRPKTTRQIGKTPDGSAY